jgi:hypothetical protein
VETKEQKQIEGTFDAAINVSAPITLDVAVDSGLVRVRAGEDGVVLIRGILRARHSLFGWGNVENRIRQLEVRPPIQHDGNTIRVGDVADRWLLRGVTLFLEIAVPADTRVRALADSGDIRVEGTNAPADCEADSGDVEIFSVDADVHASTDSGTIRIRQMKGRVRANADSGDIEALDIAGDVEASTDSGDIRVSQTMAASIRAEADSGSIDVKLAPEAGYNVSLRTDHGRLTTPEMEFRGRPTHKEIDGRIRGGGPLVDLETDSGSIDVG